MPFRILKGTIVVALTVGGLGAQTAAIVGHAPGGPSGVAGAPALGYVFDALADRFTAVIGVAGSALRGADLKPGLSVGAATVAPSQDYALIAERESGAVWRVSFRGPATRISAGTLQGVDLIAISPASLSALLYSSRSGRAELVSGLAGTPEVTGSFDFSALSGKVAAMAVNDAGDTALVAMSDAGTAALFAFKTSSAPAVIYRSQAIASVAFLRNSHDAVVALPAENKVILIRDATGTASAQTVADAETGVAAPVAAMPSDDGLQVFAANASGRILAIPLSGATPGSVSCSCQPTGMQHLRGGDVFLLSAPGTEIKVLDGSALHVHAVPSRESDQ